MFDVPIAERASERFRVEVPELGDDWQIGPDRRPLGQRQEHHRPASSSATGSTAAAAWPRDRAVVDCLGDRPIKEITGLFTAVGFSSPPSWIKPYHVLSRRRAVSLRPGPGAGRGRARRIEPLEADSPSRSSPSTSSPAWSIATWPGSARRRSPRAIRGGTDRLPVRGRHLPLRRDRVARARLGHRHGHVDSSHGGVFGDRRSSLRSFVAGVVRGGCLRVITI